MIFIQIENYRIRRLDQYNIVIEKERRMEKPPVESRKQRSLYEERSEGGASVWYAWDIQGYYPSLKSALRDFPERLWTDPQVADAQDYFRRWERAVEELRI